MNEGCSLEIWALQPLLLLFWSSWISAATFNSKAAVLKLCAGHCRASRLQPWNPRLQKFVFFFFCFHQNLSQDCTICLKNHLFHNLLKYTKNNLQNIKRTLKLAIHQDECIRIIDINPTYYPPTPAPSPSLSLAFSLSPSLALSFSKTLIGVTATLTIVVLEFVNQRCSLQF